MKKITRLILLSALAVFASCQKEEGGGGAASGSSTESFFFKENFNFNLLNVADVVVPVVRLGQSGDLTVEITTTGASLFSIPGSVTIADGDRMAEIPISFDKSKLAYYETYEIPLTIKGYSSLYGYADALVKIDNPVPADLPYSVYGSGTIVEGWWGEEEEKDMFYRDCGGGLYECYLPECWGHDSGAGYPVQDYRFFWDTKTNKLYVPFQFMGCDDWCIGDQGSIACKFGGPNYVDGLHVWRDYIDGVYKTSSFTQPHYDPSTKSFYLSDSAACSPSTGAVTYGKAGTPDVFTLL